MPGSLFIEKASKPGEPNKEYIKPGQKVAPGTVLYHGPHGGVYYIPSDKKINSDEWEVPPEEEDDGLGDQDEDVQVWKPGEMNKPLPTTGGGDLSQEEDMVDHKFPPPGSDHIIELKMGEKVPEKTMLWKDSQGKIFYSVDQDGSPQDQEGLSMNYHKFMKDVTEGYKKDTEKMGFTEPWEYMTPGLIATGEEGWKRRLDTYARDATLGIKDSYDELETDGKKVVWTLALFRKELFDMDDYDHQVPKAWVQEAVDKALGKFRMNPEAKADVQPHAAMKYFYRALRERVPPGIDAEGGQKRVDAFLDAISAMEKEYDLAHKKGHHDDVIPWDTTDLTYDFAKQEEGTSGTAFAECMATDWGKVAAVIRMEASGFRNKQIEVLNAKYKDPNPEATWAHPHLTPQGKAVNKDNADEIREWTKKNRPKQKTWGEALHVSADQDDPDPDGKIYDSLSGYTGNEFNGYKAALRQRGRYWDGERMGEYSITRSQKNVEAIDKFMKKSKIDYDEPILHGVGSLKSMNIPEGTEPEVGGLIWDDSFTSWSTDPWTSYDFTSWGNYSHGAVDHVTQGNPEGLPLMLCIQNPKGTPGIWSDTSEWEYILPHGMKYKITKIEDVNVSPNATWNEFGPSSGKEHDRFHVITVEPVWDEGAQLPGVPWNDPNVNTRDNPENRKSPLAENPDRDKREKKHKQYLEAAWVQYKKYAVENPRNIESWGHKDHVLNFLKNMGIIGEEADGYWDELKQKEQKEENSEEAKVWGEKLMATKKIFLEDSGMLEGEIHEVLNETPVGIAKLSQYLDSQGITSGEFDDQVLDYTKELEAKKNEAAADEYVKNSSEKKLAEEAEKLTTLINLGMNEDDLHVIQNPEAYSGMPEKEAAFKKLKEAMISQGAGVSYVNEMTVDMMLGSGLDGFTFKMAPAKPKNLDLKTKLGKILDTPLPMPEAESPEDHMNTLVKDYQEWQKKWPDSPLGPYIKELRQAGATDKEVEAFQARVMALKNKPD